MPLCCTLQTASQVHEISREVCFRRKLLKEVLLLAESEGSVVTEAIATPYADTLLQPDQVYFHISHLHISLSDNRNFFSRCRPFL